MVSRAKSWRRARGRLRPGGKASVRRGGLSGGLRDRVAPEEADQSQVAVEPRPTAALVIAQPQLLLPILVEPLDHPAPVGELQLVLERAALEPPGEVPFWIPARPWQWALPDEPAQGPGVLALSPMHAHAAGQAFAAASLLVEDAHAAPASRRHAVEQVLWGVAG